MKVSNYRFVCTLCGKTGHNVLECGWLNENLLYSFWSSRQHLPFNWENIYTDGVGIIIASMTGAKPANVPWFDSDITNLNDSWNLVIHITIGTASVVQYTLDGGTKWINLNNGENLVAGSGYTFIMQVMKDDAFNLRHTNTTAGDVDIVIARLSYGK